MIEVNVNTARYKVTVTGHALPEENERYKEICNAVGALVQGLAYAVTKYEKDHDPFKSFEWRPVPGDTMLRVWPEEWAERTMRRYISIYADGIELLAMTYPESIHMIRDGEEIKDFGGEKE